MTEAKANEIFRTKYPEGEIVRKYASSAGYQYFVVFNSRGKVYYYSATSYAELLRRFGFNVVYRHDIKTVEYYIEKYTKELEDLYDGVVPVGYSLCSIKSDEELIEDAIITAEKELDYWNKKLKYYLEECIIDER